MIKTAVCKEIFNRCISDYHIIDDVMTGFSQPDKVARIVDRADAIHRSIAYARQGESVLIAGKGHEDYQIIGDQRLYFCDVTVAELALREGVSA